MKNKRAVMTKKRRAKNRQIAMRKMIKAAIRTFIASLPVFGIMFLSTVTGIAWLMNDDKVFNMLCNIELILVSVYVMIPGAQTLMKIQTKFRKPVKNNRKRDKSRDILNEKKKGRYA